MYQSMKFFALLCFITCLFTAAPRVAAQTKATAATGEVEKEKKNRYKIQVGAYKTIAKGKFDNLNDVGSVYLEDAGKGMKRIIVGDFADREKAEETLAKIKGLGYNQAYIITQTIETEAPPTNSNSAAATNGNTKENTPAVEKMEFQNAPAETVAQPVYLIQLGAYKSINLKSFGNVVDLGELVLENDKGVTKVTISKFTTRPDAEKALSVVKQRGYVNAFIREEK